MNDPTIGASIGPDARGESMFALVSALSDGHSAMLKAISAVANKADEGNTERPNAGALSQLLTWGRQKAGPPSLRKEPPDNVNWLAFIAPPWFGLDVQGWALWQQRLQNFFDEYAESYLGQYVEATFNLAETFRKQFNEWAAKFRPAGMDVADVAQKELAPIAPSAEDVKKAAEEAARKAAEAAKKIADAAGEAGKRAAAGVFDAILPIAGVVGALGVIYILAKRAGREPEKREPRRPF